MKKYRCRSIKELASQLDQIFSRPLPKKHKWFLHLPQGFDLSPIVQDVVFDEKYLVRLNHKSLEPISVRRSNSSSLRLGYFDLEELRYEDSCEVELDLHLRNLLRLR